MVIPGRCGFVGWSSVSIGLGGVWWGANVGCSAIYCLKRPSRGGGSRTRELLR